MTSLVRFRSLMVLVGMLVVTSVAYAAVQKFRIDNNHTRITFVASTLLFDVDGAFDRYTINAEGDPETLAGFKLRAEIDAASINTANEMRDRHLRTPDFFNVEQFPKIVFTSNSATREGDRIVVAGTLDMHGHQKPVRVTFSKVTARNGAGNMETVFKGQLTLNRNDYAIGADSVAAKISLEDEVKIKLVIAGFFE